MLNRVLALTAAATLVAGAAFAAPGKDKKAPKVTDVKYCPIMNSDVKDTKGATSSVVGKYKIYFCCPGCKPQFDKLSKAEKDKKVAEAVKKAKKVSTAKPESNVATAEVASAKLIDLRTCPTTGEKVEGDGGGSEVVGNYKVYFCCAGCKPSFDALSKTEKEKKVASLAKK
jgi:iron-sulfur cluster repair protein YtfE (RIC family)